MRSMIANWPAGGPSGPAHSRALGVAALIAWLLTVSLGAYMARAWIGGGGLRRRRAGDDELPPAVLVGHASLAVTGLFLWAGYVASGLAALAWAATGIIAAAIGLGVSTVTLWTPYPVRQPVGPDRTLPGPGPGPGPGDAVNAPGDGPSHGPSHGPDDPHWPEGSDRLDGPAFEVTDEMLNALLTSPPPASRRRRRPQALIPLFHGIGAITTFLLAVLTVVGTL
jgi:hypothetical protein